MSVVSGSLLILFTTDDGQRTTDTALADNLGQNIAFAKDLVFFAVDFNFRAAVFAVDDFVADAVARGWTRLEADGHPIAGGADVVFLEDADGFEVELVAPSDRQG